MIGTAAGRMADDTTHQMRLSDVKKIGGLQNHTRQTILPFFAEFRATTIIHDDTEKRRVTIGACLMRLPSRGQRRHSDFMGLRAHLPPHGSGIEPLGHSGSAGGVPPRWQVLLAAVPATGRPEKPLGFGRPGVLPSGYQRRRGRWLHSAGSPIRMSGTRHYRRREIRVFSMPLIQGALRSVGCAGGIPDHGPAHLWPVPRPR